jgi:hypothetical protein
VGLAGRLTRSDHVASDSMRSFFDGQDLRESVYSGFGSGYVGLIR